MGDEAIQLRGDVNLMHWRDIQEKIGLGNFLRERGEDAIGEIFC